MSQVLVAPFEPSLLGRLRGRAVVLRVDRAENLAPAMNAGKEHGLDVRRVWLTTNVPLTMVPLADLPQRAAPLALSVPAGGPFRQLLRQLPALRALRARVHLPVAPPENLITLRQLASLGVECAAVLSADADWDALADLLSYALLGIAAHAPVQPFAYLAEAYRPDRRTDFGSVTFDDPLQFLHVDAAGRLALSADDLAAGRFLPLEVDRLEEVPSLPAYTDRLDSWTRFFLRADGCSCCPGFRICLGKLDGAGASAQGCGQFFGEALDVIEQAQRARAKREAS